jgi:cell wall-associated NlpC family hydrolase
VTRPTATALAFARSTLPVRRVASGASSTSGSGFAALLRTAAAKPKTVPGGATAGITHAAMLPGAGPAPISTSEILANAQQLLNIPYVWGGTSVKGLDCSAFISKAWAIGRQTTDSLSRVAQPVAKDELQAGDALNLTIGKDTQGDGHVRMFDKWANPEHTRMWVYEETPPQSIHHVINWDPHYQPLRRLNTVAH